MRNDHDRVLDMMEAIEKIDLRLPVCLEAFVDDETLLVWTVYHIQVLGEAAARVSKALRERWPGFPWADVIAMRNVLVHHYFGIDAREVWNTARRDLPELREHLRRLMEAEFPEVDAE